ncbi:MAG: hypothetical protein AAF727_01075 [Pseudomonadota bacterium]
MLKQIMLAALIAVAACGALEPMTLAAVSRLNPLTTDPGDLAVRVTLPDSVGLVHGSAVLSLSAVRRDGAETGGAFALRRRADVFDVDPGDHDALRALQAQIATWKAEDDSGTTGSLSVGFEPCRTGDAIPSGARASVDIQMAADGPFLPLLTDADVRQMFKKAAQGPIAPCQ